MNIDKIGEISAIGFDIDGTLYKNWRLNIRVVPHILKHFIFFTRYSKNRKIMHTRDTKSSADFTETQNIILGGLLKCSPEKAGELEHQIVTKGLAKYFPKIKTCKGAVELIKDLKQAGYKIALLSDFTPKQKGEIWGIKPFCDVILGSSDCGALKPSALPFNKMAEDLNVPPENILYVGNSLSLDIGGAKGAGMKSAWFASKSKCKSQKGKTADFSFWDYQQLRNLLLPEGKTGTVQQN